MSSALQGACAHGHAQIVALLIEYGADIEERSGDSQSPLTTAASAGSLETMKALLAAGATLYNAERAVNVLRTLIVREKPRDIIDYVLALLLDTDYFVNACKEVPAYMRAWQESAEFVLNVDTMPSSEQLLVNLAALGAQRSIELKLESSVNMADVSAPLLQAAAYFQSYEVLFWLLSLVVIPEFFSSGSHTPVYALLEGLMPIKPKTDRHYESLCCEAWAADSFRYSRFFDQTDKKCTCDNTRAAASEAILKLVQMNEDYICTSVGILHLAYYLGMLQVVQVCLELGVDINQRYEYFESALTAAIKGGSLEVIKLLLEHHIDVQTTSRDDGTTTGTALHMACQNKDREMARIILQHGSKVNVFVPGMGTPLHIACEKRDEEMLRLLLIYGADVGIISPDLGAALQDFGLVKILLQHGANVNVFSPDHGTPLHAACTGHGDDATIQLLSEYGADVNSKDSKGETPFTPKLSQTHGHFSERLIESLLKSEQQLDITETDLDHLVTKFRTSTPEIQLCKRILENNPHLQPTIETIRSVLAGYGHLGSDILRLLLARAPNLEITLEIVRKANNLESFELLTQYGSCIKITADVMETFLHPLELNLVKYSVQSVPDVRPPPAVVTAIRSILDKPEPKPKANRSLQDELFTSFLQYSQSIQNPIAKEIMELILARHPDVEGLPSTTVPDESQKNDPEA
jgi:ankyrin repeat protein